jgi:hypothetical protein
MRLFLLRALIGWWMVVGTWTVIFALVWLMTGSVGETVETCKEISHGVWWGM